MTNILLTGGAGFIGSHVADYIIGTCPNAKLTILDKMTYAAHYANLEFALSHRNCQLVEGDMCDFSLCKKLTEGAELVLNLAAESHVDNSFGNSLAFTRTNVLGTHALMEACRVNKVNRIVHVSTDEVYGDILSGSYDESSALNPTNPYSASKAAAEMIIKSYVRSFKMPIAVVRANNIYGTRQYPEKIIPKFCILLLKGKKLPIHGDGSNIRSYLSVHDFAEALLLLAEKGKAGEIYNVGTSEEYSNLDIASMLCRLFGEIASKQVEFVEDRPFNDRRYSLSSDKINAFGWKPKLQLSNEIGKIMAWYKENIHRYNEIDNRIVNGSIRQIALNPA